MIITIYSQDGQILTRATSPNEFKATISRSKSVGKDNEYFLVELERVFVSPIDGGPMDFCGEVYYCGLYRTHDAAANELLRLWHMFDKGEKADYCFEFQRDPRPVRPLELVKLRTAFI